MLKVKTHDESYEVWALPPPLASSCPHSLLLCDSATSAIQSFQHAIYSLLLEVSLSFFCLINSQTSFSVQYCHSPSPVLPGQLPRTHSDPVL